MDKVISKTKYNSKQHRAFYTFHMFARSASTYFIMALALFVLGWAIYNATKLTDPKQIMVSWLMASFTLMLLPILMIGKVNNVVKKETRERKDSTDIIEVTKAKLQRFSDHKEGRLVFGWHQIDIICETRKYIYIYTAPNQGIFIVKSDITEGNIDLFRRLAQNNMKKNKKGKVRYRKYFREVK